MEHIGVRCRMRVSTVTFWASKENLSKYLVHFVKISGSRCPTGKVSCNPGCKALKTTPRGLRFGMLLNTKKMNVSMPTQAYHYCRRLVSVYEAGPRRTVLSRGRVLEASAW